MNKKISLAALLLSYAFSAFAQNEDHIVKKGTSHFYLGYGFPNRAALEMNSGNMGGADLSPSSIGPITASYQYAMNDHLTIGAQFNYAAAKASLSWSYIDPYWGGTSSGKLEESLHIYNINGRLDYHYLKSSRVDVYSGVALGYANLGAKVSGDLNPSEASLSVSFGGLGLGAQTGIRVMFTKNIGIFAEGSGQYIYVESTSLLSGMLCGGITFATTSHKTGKQQTH